MMGKAVVRPVCRAAVSPRNLQTNMTTAQNKAVRLPLHAAHSNNGEAWIEIENASLTEALKRHLIYAAAPELLAALESAMSKEGDFAGWEKRARAAITKAKGAQ